MGVQERRGRERQATRERIVDAARELFVREGYDGVTMRKVAQKIEYSATAIYVHFKDKRDLFLNVCLEDFGRLASAFSGLAKIGDLRERLRKTGQVYIDFGLKYPKHYRLMFMTPLSGVEQHEEEEMAAGKGNPERDAYAFLRLCVQQAMNAGVFRPGFDDADLLAQTMWAGVHGVISLHIAKSEDNWVPWRTLKKRSEAMLDGLMRGLLRESR